MQPGRGCGSSGARSCGPSRRAGCVGNEGNEKGATAVAPFSAGSLERKHVSPDFASAAPSRVVEVAASCTAGVAMTLTRRELTRHPMGVDEPASPRFPWSAENRFNGVSHGRLAQLVEHLVYTEGVGGSSPSPPMRCGSQAIPGTKEAPSWKNTRPNRTRSGSSSASATAATTIQCQARRSGQCRRTAASTRPHGGEGRHPVAAASTRTSVCLGRPQLEGWHPAPPWESPIRRSPDNGSPCDR